MKIICTASEYVRKLYVIKDHCPTYYGYGAVGAPADYTYEGRSYKNNRERYNVPEAPEGSFIFDCAGYAYKAIPWGFCGDPNKCYGGANWPPKGAPFSELDTNDILSICTDVSEDFSKIKRAEVLYMPGHVGVYVGDGLALECTSGWGVNKVIETTVLNLKPTDMLHYSRTWIKHGKLPFIDYETEEKQDHVDINSLTSALEIAGDCLNGVHHELGCLKNVLDEMSVQISKLKGDLK